MSSSISFNSKYVNSLIEAIRKCKKTTEDAFNTFERAGSYLNFKKISIDTALTSKIHSSLSTLVSSLSSEASSLYNDKVIFEKAEHGNIMGGTPEEFLMQFNFGPNPKISNKNVSSQRLFFKSFAKFGCYGVKQNTFTTPKYKGAFELNVYQKGSDSKTDGPYGTVQMYYSTEESERLQDYLVEEYGFSKRDAAMCLDIVDSIGACTYAATANAIIYEYKDKEEEFEEIFGFPLYIGTENDYQYNGDQLLLDMYIYANSEDNGGKLFINSSDGSLMINYSDQYVTQEKINDLKVFRNSNSANVDPMAVQALPSRDDIGIISVDGEWVSLSDFKGDTYTAKAKKQEYMINSSEGFNDKILSTYVQKDGKSVIETEIVDTFENGLDEDGMIQLVDDCKAKMGVGEQLVLTVAGSDVYLPSMASTSDDSTYVFNNKNVGHAMYVTDITDDSFIVASWGREYEFSFDELQNAYYCLIVSIDSK